MVKGVALEDVVDWGKEGGDDHDGNASVVEAREEDVETARVAAEEMAKAACKEAEHGASEKNKEGPPGSPGGGRGRGSGGWPLIELHERGGCTDEIGLIAGCIFHCT